MKSETTFEDVIQLLHKYLQEGLSAPEQVQLDQWVNDSAENRTLFERLDDPEQLQEEIALYYRARESMRSKLEEAIPALGMPQAAPSIPMWRKWGWAAAVALLLAGAGTYYLLQRRPDGPKDGVAVMVGDIPPGSNKAVLTLSDGSTMTLDSAGRQVIQQGATAVRQQGGTLQYEAAEVSNEAVAYNILTTPRGGQFQVRLPDGTQVWLNAESSLRYPTTFGGKERLVEITGEGYFEIAKNAGKPFRVLLPGKTEVEVLGTSFNVHAYTDESEIGTTLVEGRIKVGGTLVKPGQQLLVASDGNGPVRLENNVDLEKVTAWKNGLFNFDGVKLKDAMLQISRWYDIEVVYEKGVPNVEFVGKIERGTSLADLLKGLEGFDVHFRINGRRLIITP